jgi:hypothetical protein
MGDAKCWADWYNLCFQDDPKATMRYIAGIVAGHVPQTPGTSMHGACKCALSWADSNKSKLEWYSIPAQALVGLGGQRSGAMQGQSGAIHQSEF